MEQPFSSVGLKDTPVLVVEDEFIIALELQAVLADAGAKVIGPAHSVSEAMDLLGARPACAILDLRLGREPITPVARELRRLAIPFIFYTGQPREELSDWPDIPLLSKPAPAAAVVGALCLLLGRHKPNTHSPAALA
jgi:CheY-like chemotaxis protein